MDEGFRVGEGGTGDARWGAGTVGGNSEEQRSGIRNNREMTMLVLSRKLGEKIVIGDNIVVTVVKIDRNQIRIGIEAPHDVPVYREEIAPQRAGEVVGDRGCRLESLNVHAADRQEIDPIRPRHPASGSAAVTAGLRGRPVVPSPTSGRARSSHPSRPGPSTYPAGRDGRGRDRPLDAGSRRNPGTRPSWRRFRETPESDVEHEASWATGKECGGVSVAPARGDPRHGCGTVE